MFLVDSSSNFIRHLFLCLLLQKHNFYIYFIITVEPASCGVCHQWPLVLNDRFHRHVCIIIIPVMRDHLSWDRFCWAEEVVSQQWFYCIELLCLWSKYSCWCHSMITMEVTVLTCDKTTVLCDNTNDPLPGLGTINVFWACLGAQLTICAQKWRNFVCSSTLSLRFVLS